MKGSRPQAPMALVELPALLNETSLLQRGRELRPFHSIAVHPLGDGFRSVYCLKTIGDATSLGGISTVFHSRRGIPKDNCQQGFPTAGRHTQDFVAYTGR